MTIAEGDSRITEPEVLSEEALKLADLNLLKSLNEAPARRRGRPPGSRNKPKEAGLVGHGGPMSLVTPKGRRTTSEPDKLDPFKVAQAKKDKAETYAARIVTEVNDHLFTILIGLGMPAEWIFKDGKGPKAVPFRSDLTDIGNSVAIKPDQAKAIASFLAELEFTQAGSKVAETVSQGPVVLLVKGVIAGLSVVQWGSSLNRLRKQLEPLIEAKRKAAQMVQEEQQSNDGQTTVRWVEGWHEANLQMEAHKNG